MTKERDDEPVDVSAGLANAAKRLINGSKNTDRNRARESARNNLRSARWYHVASAIAAPTGSDFFTSGPATLQKRNGSQLVPTGKIETIYSDAAIEADTIVLVRQAGGIPFAISNQASRPTLITIQAPADGIPAAFDYIFGSEICNVLISDPNDPGHWVDSGRTEEVFNPSTEVQLVHDPTQAEPLGFGLGFAVWDGAKYVLISRLCNDTRIFLPAFTL